MNIARHISLDEEYIEKIKPYLDKHSGNFCVAIREIITRAGEFNSHIDSPAIDISLFNWILKEIDGILIPDNILDELIPPMLIDSMDKLEAYLNRRFSELKWGVNLVLKCDIDMFPSDVWIEIRGVSQKIKFVARILSQYLVKNSLERAPLKIKSVVDFNEIIRIELSRSDKKEALASLIRFFGGTDEIIRAIKSRPDFWKAIISKHFLSNYNMITINRNYFEDLLSDKIPAGETMIEDLAKKPVQDIPLKEMLPLIKVVYETSRIADRVDIDEDTLIVSHNYRNKNAIEKLKKSLVALLETCGHLYNTESTANMIVLRHRPDVGTKIDEIVDKLKTSNSRVDQELVMFMAFLKGLEDIPDIPLSLTALGRRIGKSLMQEYEKENGIKNWELGTFQKALERIDSRLHRESEWNVDGRNLLYRVRKCNITVEGNIFDTYVCHIARETFKGALNYAFRDKAELNIKRLLTHGDNSCEVVIRIP